MNKTFSVITFMIAAGMTASIKPAYAAEESKESRHSNFPTLREHVIERQTSRIAIMQKELECTKQAQNREQLRTCGDTARNANQMLNEKHLSDARKYYNLQK